ncbi:flocculation protein FLO11-like [Aphis craccivora]|uniref:Flocculation protein FLO11-like n=1 Tax=Aphis craccivora TaxID=307492 RepID=A0A6G0ZQV4_APHCR|nr:flocculation protein FLO11-like [Aphis craccivora]
MASDGVHSCVLRSHREKVAGLQPECSIPGAADPTSANSRHTVAPCATPKLGLQYPDVLNKIPSISPVSFKSSPLIPTTVVTPPPVTIPQYLTPVSGISSNDRILLDLLLEYLATQEASRRLPLPPSSSPFRTPKPASLPVVLTPTPYPSTPNQQNAPVNPQQVLSHLLSVSGPGSDLINPAVPSDHLLPSLSSTPATHITAPPPGVTAVQNAKIEATAAIVPIDIPKSTSLPETTSTISEPSSTSPATDSNSVSVNAAVQSSDPGLAEVAAVAPVNSSSDSSIVAPETSGTALKPAASPEPAPAPVSNTVPAADSVSPSTSAAVESLEPLSQTPSNNTTPSIV